MTRLLFGFTLIACLAIVASAVAQTTGNGTAPSRYAPRVGTGAAARPFNAQSQSAQAQPGGAYGPQPANAQPQVRVATGNPSGQPVRQASGQEPIRQPSGPAGIAPAVPITPQQPAWIPLDPAHEKWVGEILAFWEQESNKVKTFECKFQRWEYDPVFGPANEAKTFAEGVIKYAQPDKGLYRIEKLSSYSPLAKAGDKPQYIEQDATFGEHWVCDGKQIFAFNARNKQMVVSALPPEVQGRAIVDGPLPFLFGAKAETIKARYWIRGLPQSGNGKFWLEAVPKGRADAQNFKMIHIVLDGTTFLPEMLQLFAPNYNDKTNPSRTTHVFKDIETTDANALAALVKGANFLNVFHREFYEPKLPSGWKRVVESGASVPSSAALEVKEPPAPKSRSFSPLPR